MTTISALPTPPTPADAPADFNTKAFNLIGALQAFVTQANAVAGEVNTNATSASSSASTATTAKTSAETARDTAISNASAAASANTAAQAALAAVLDAYDSFDDRMLGRKDADPTVDNDGNPLVGGAIYFNLGISNPTIKGMRLYDGTTWDMAYVTGASYLSKANNLSDLPNKATARGNLGLVAVAASGAYSDLSGTPDTNMSYGLFYKANPNAVAFTKTGAATLQIKAGTRIDVAGTMVTYASATSVAMPTLTAGEDYSIWVKTDGTIQAIADPYSSPASAPGAGTWRKIGGFHYGLVASGTTVAGGSFATTGNGMIWAQSDVNAYSLWDLRWTIKSIDRQPRGMAFDPWVNAWAAIYFCPTNHMSSGISRYNTDVASSSVLPRKPLAYGGTGTTTYSNGNWWTFNEVAASFGLRLPSEREFQSTMFGVTEAQSLGGSSVTIPSTGRQAGYTSRIGCEQATGHMWTWGADTGHYGETFAWSDVTGGRGQSYTSYNTKVLLGGGRNVGSFSGSRASFWDDYPWSTNWGIGLRAFGDLLVL
jgi:hypothetical protein